MDTNEVARRRNAQWFIAALVISIIALPVSAGFGEYEQVFVIFAVVTALFVVAPAVFVTYRIRTMRLTRSEQMRVNGGSHTADEWRKLCESYNYRCAACNKKRPLTKDHIVAVTQGGTDDIVNLQPLCRVCNSRKHGRTMEYKPVVAMPGMSEAVRDMACPKCGRELTAGQMGAAKRYGYCKACKGV
jgi:hypothetical protein